MVSHPDDESEATPSNGEDIANLKEAYAKITALKEHQAKWEDLVTGTLIPKNSNNNYDSGVRKHFKRCLQHSSISLEKSPHVDRILQAAYHFVTVKPALPTKGNNRDSAKFLRPEQTTLVEAYLGALMSAGALKETTEQEVMNHTGAPIENPLFLKEDSENGAWDFRVILDARPANRYIKWDKTGAIALKRLIPLMREKQNVAAHMKKTQIGNLRYHTKLDLLGAYYQLRLPDRIKYYTTFRWKGKLYCFNSMPYGLGVASSVLNVVTKYLIGQFWQSMLFDRKQQSPPQEMAPLALLTEQIHNG